MNYNIFMKKYILVILFLVILTNSFSLDCSKISPNDITHAIINYSATGNIYFNFDSPKSKIENFNALIRIVPQKDVLIFYNDGSLGKDIWDNDIVNFNKSKITNTQEIWKFNSLINSQRTNIKVPFNLIFPYPATEFPEEVKQYLEFSQIADTNNQIREVTNDLLEGVNDYLTAIAKVSEFTAY